MIEHVAGTLVEKTHTLAVVDVQGLGYQIIVPTSTYQQLPASGESVKLFTHQHVREDAVLLFGFFTRPERAMFKAMIGTSGVGPKLALAALSAMSPAEIGQAVLGDDSGRLTYIPGIGRKTAERLVLELRDRVAMLDLTDGDARPLTGAAEARADALAALEVLGLTRAAAERRIRKALAKHPHVSTADELIRLVLRE